MIYYDILISRKLKFNKIAEGISQMFSLNSSEIIVVNQIPEHKMADRILILCQVQNIEGDFLQLISIYGKNLPAINIYQLASYFSNKYKCECLIPDDSLNPFSMTLIKGIDNYQTVYLSPTFLEEDKYIIS